jgi:hypothetical protein
MPGNGAVGAVAEAVNVLTSMLNVLIRHLNEHVCGNDEVNDADSSMISAFGYDEAEGILEVAFHRTGVYRYYDVPLHVFEGLRDAESKGRYMRGHIIDMYPWEKKRGRSRGR